jgi:pimeloyl-ACP methyl ester carboxylesterase
MATKTEHYLKGGTYYTYHKKRGNEHVFISGTGQSVSPRAFWDIELPDGKTHAEHMVEAGIDVICVDPIGYGKSKFDANDDFRNYDRKVYGKQLVDVGLSLKKEYKSRAVFGMCASTGPTLVAGFDPSGYFNRVIIHSPFVQKLDQIPESIDITQNMHSMTFDQFLHIRLGKLGDLMVADQPNGNVRFDNFNENFKKVVGETWTGPYNSVYDVSTYWAKHKDYGFKPNKKAKVLSVVGEFDAEVLKVDWSVEGFNNFKELFPKAKHVTIPGSTHFSMWEKNCDVLRNEMIKFITK